MFKINKEKNINITKSMRIPKEIVDRIEEICKKEDITFTEFVTQALEYVLKDYKR